MELIREVNEDYVINSMTDCLKYLEEFRKEDREYFIVLGLDTQNKVLYRDVVSIGTLNSAIIHPREIFKTAIIKSANSIIISHNHPSGNTNPSKEDREVYIKLKKAGEILDIKVLDSIIITPNDILSLNEE